MCRRGGWQGFLCPLMCCSAIFVAEEAVDVEVSADCFLLEIHEHTVPHYFTNMLMVGISTKTQ